MTHHKSRSIDQKGNPGAANLDSNLGVAYGETKDKAIENLKGYEHLRDDQSLDEEVDHVLSKVRHKKALQTYSHFFKNKQKHLV